MQPRDEGPAAEDVAQVVKKAAPAKKKTAKRPSKKAAAAAALAKHVASSSVKALLEEAGADATKATEILDVEKARGDRARPTLVKKLEQQLAPPAEPESPDMFGAGVRVIGVTGPFGCVTLLQMPTSLAEQMFRGQLEDAAPLEVIEAVARDVAAIRERDEQLADSALAAAAMALAREISNPYNSATSKSMCAREMREHLDRLRELLPPEQEADRLDEIARAREARRERAAGGSGT